MLPEAFQQRMRLMMGEEYEDFLKTFGEERYHALRLNPLKKDQEGHTVLEKYRDGNMTGFAHLTEVPWACGGYYYKGEDQPGKHPFHDAGLYYIQEPSAMVPVTLLEACLGERVLDLCAAPGGKSTQIGAAMQGKGILICNEINAARAKILSENVERMGICNACVTNETPERLAEFFPGYFHRILVDAPCSGEGMFRKNEAACQEWSPENVELCAGRQDGILDCAARMLCPGGRLVYSTCTFAPEENEGSIGRFLQRHGDFEILPVDEEKLGFGAGRYPVRFNITDNISGLEHTLRIWPHRVKGEGHFAAVLRKTGSLREDLIKGGGQVQIRHSAAGGAVKGIAEKEAEGLEEFCRENIRLPADFRSGGLFSGIGQAVGMGEAVKGIRFGGHIYLVPGEMPSLKGLKVLRPCLHLGEIRKNRFEPSHALALVLPPEYGAHIWNLKAEDALTAAYLKGQTFPAQGEKGWYLVCIEGFTMGWGKLAGGIMKNHYPRGLRRRDFMNFIS